MGKYTYEFVEQIIKDKGGCLLSTTYNRVDDKIKIKCLSCENIWETDFHMILKGIWCGKCYHLRTRLTNDFVATEIQKRGGILLTPYINKRTPLDIKCNVCGHIWHPDFNDIMKNNWCPNCSKTKKYTIERVREEIEKRGGKLISTEYINVFHKLEILCLQCNNVWKQTLSQIINQGVWCPCTRIRKNKTETALFKIMQSILPDNIVEHGYYEFPWLKRTSGRGKIKQKLGLDIYVRDIKLVIEYDGQQHFMPVCFGGMNKKRARRNFKMQQRRDAFKNKQIARHPEDVKYFIRIPYTEKITEENVLRILKENNIPIKSEEE